MNGFWPLSYYNAKINAWIHLCKKNVNYFTLLIINTQKCFVIRIKACKFHGLVHVLKKHRDGSQGLGYKALYPGVVCCSEYP